MRLLLDAHVSGRRIADALREQGGDVRAADEERELDGWEDELLLELATAEARIMVTLNVKDFARLVSEWAAAGTRHAGCLMIVGIDHAEFGLTLRVIQTALRLRAVARRVVCGDDHRSSSPEARPEQDAWTDYAAWGTRAAGG